MVRSEGKASGCFLLFTHLGRLKAVQVGNRPLRMGRRLEDRPLVILEDLEPGLKVTGMIGPGFELGHNAEIGAQKAAPKLGNELFPCTVGTILVIAG